MEKIIFCLFICIASCYARDAFPFQMDGNFQTDCLDTSNNYRTQHHVTKFKVDNELVEYAKTRCQLMSQYEGLSHGHAGLRSGTGENLYWGGNSANVFSSCKSAVTDWYNEVNQYDFNNPGFGMSTGHFTQLVWKGTTSVGCARCGGKGGDWYETYVVCNYKPPGNMNTAQAFRENVLKK